MRVIPPPCLFPRSFTQALPAPKRTHQTLPYNAMPPKKTPLTRSRATMPALFPAADSSASTPTEIASSGYGDKDAAVAKGKPIPAGLHFTRNATNTYTGSAVKGHTSNSFAPLTADQDTAIDSHSSDDLLAVDITEIDLVSDGNDSDIEAIDNPNLKGSPNSAYTGPGDVTPKPVDPLKLVARRLANAGGNPAPTPAAPVADVPFSMIVAGAQAAIGNGSPFLAPVPQPATEPPTAQPSEDGEPIATKDKGKGRATPNTLPATPPSSSTPPSTADNGAEGTASTATPTTAPTTDPSALDTAINTPLPA
ncbi:hypothetical protein MVEN_00000300 [Mycena venus]|uniref:Uncharacterized protein n=1 Tax=Mycena venus TaxID=2733690 RepID=A0A8H6Z2K9_9AGAR|nr:hypothetical protein MVEN_00000300 [Mycena venus]